MSYALLFPGQGSQRMGMGKELYEEHIEARQILESACEFLDYQSLADIAVIDKPSKVEGRSMVMFLTAKALKK